MSMPWWTQSKKEKWKKKRRKKKWVRKEKSMKDTRNGRNKEMDVLQYMLVTFAVFHLERSALNTDADRNAVKVNAVVDPIEKEKVEEERNG
jgi:hypothetical protein